MTEVASPALSAVGAACALPRLLDAGGNAAVQRKVRSSLAARPV